MLARENPQIGRNNRYWDRFAGKDMPSSQGLSGLQKYLDDCLAVDRGRFDVFDVAARIALVSAPRSQRTPRLSVARPSRRRRLTH